MSSHGSNLRGEQLRLSTWGTMEVIGTDQGAGRLYRCACGWEGWSSWGHARRHAASCPQSGRVPDPVGLVDARPA
jgi:hypothetical protein